MPRNPNTRPTSIYWLVDVRPETLMTWPNGFPFYCGKTVSDVALRFKNHRTTAARYPNRPVSAWFKKCGSHVRLQVMEVVPATGKWGERERFWIRTLRRSHPGCANVADGGSGVPGTVQSSETRAKIAAAHRGKKLSAETCEKLRNRIISDETRAKLSAAKKGFKHSVESRAKMSAGRKGRVFSPEHLAKIKAAVTGRKLSPEHVAKMRGRKLSAETRAKISAAMTGRRGRKFSPEHCAKIAAANRLRVISPETRAKISASRKGKATTTGMKFSDESKAKMRAKKLGGKHTPEHRAKMVESRRRNLLLKIDQSQCGAV